MKFLWSGKDMPNAVVHMVFALVCAVILAIVLHLSFIDGLILIASFVIGALMPDVDSEGSFFTRIMHLAVAGMIVAAVLYYTHFELSWNTAGYIVALFAAYFIIYHLIRPPHRGVCHSFLFALAIAVISWILTKNIIVAGGILGGMLSHDLADGVVKLI